MGLKPFFEVILDRNALNWWKTSNHRFKKHYKLQAGKYKEKNTPRFITVKLLKNKYKQEKCITNN